MTKAELLLAWYDLHARSLPWRGSKDPYAIWVSETMLQQTRVSTVLSYYPRFLAAFPDIPSLAAAPEDEVLKLWEGLGYYSRARNLHKGAKQVTEQYGGTLPADPALLRKISGIGPYTAGAIASIAYGIRAPAVDGNVIRVVSRLEGIRENIGIPSVRRSLEAAADALVPADRPGDFNQALMDLGSSVCTPGTPDCTSCPLCGVCDACREEDAEELPILPNKKPPRELNWDVILIFSVDRVLMRKRTEALLNGLWIYPMAEGHNGESDLPGIIQKRIGLTVSGLTFSREARHVFTHQIWRMRIFVCETLQATPPAGWQFIDLRGLDGITLPTAVKAATEIVREKIK